MPNTTTLHQPMHTVSSKMFFFKYFKKNKLKKKLLGISKTIETGSTQIKKPHIRVHYWVEWLGVGKLRQLYSGLATKFSDMSCSLFTIGITVDPNGGADD
ncbi:hypothetical protein V6Z11_A11G038600 [Gossypium hirsutum]